VCYMSPLSLQRDVGVNRRVIIVLRV